MRWTPGGVLAAAAVSSVVAAVLSGTPAAAATDGEPRATCPSDAFCDGFETQVGRALQWNRESDDATLPEQSPVGVAQSVPPPVGRWTCVEFGVTGSELRTWVDGSEVVGLDADPGRRLQWLRRGTWRPALSDFRLGGESYGNGDNTLWFDDVALGPSRIGCAWTELASAVGSPVRG